MKADSIISGERLSLFSNLGRALAAGVGGYILFLVILFATKTVSMFIQPKGSVEFEVTDFVLPVIGFFLLFLIKLLENLKED